MQIMKSGEMVAVNGGRKNKANKKILLNWCFVFLQLEMEPRSVSSDSLLRRSQSSTDTHQS